MANQLEIPVLNPLKFVPVNPNQDPAFYTKFSDDYIFEDTIYDWQEQVHRFQPWKQGDKIPLQFTANFEPLLVTTVDQFGNQVQGANATKVRANKYQPGSFLYETTLDTLGLPVGVYKSLITPAGSIGDQQKSEWFYVCPSNYRTIMIQYWNIRYHADVIFETGIKFNFRIPGFFKDGDPGSMDVLYADQGLDQVQISSRTFTQKTLFLGIGNGIPPWMVEKMNAIFSCSNVMFDGKLFAKADSAKWTPFEQEGSIVKGYAIDVRPGINRTSRIINPTIDTTKKVTLVYNIENSVFGNVAPSGGQLVTPITSIE